MAAAWRIDRHDTPEQLAALAPAWQALWTAAERPLLFNSPPWALAAWQHLHAREAGARPWVLTLSDGPQLLALLPLWRQRRRVLGVPVHVLRWLGDGPSDYSDLLHDAAAPGAAAALAGHLLSDRTHWDLLDLRELPPGSAWTDALQEHLAAAGAPCLRTADTLCRAIPTAGGFEAYYCRHFNSKRRRDHRRDRRLFEETGPLAEDWYADRLPLDTLLPAFAEVQAAHASAGEQRPGEFNDPVFRPFIEQVMRDAAARGWLRVATLRRDDALVAYYVAFACAGRHWVYNTAHRADVQAYSPGKLLMIFLLQRLFDEPADCIDFLRGDEAYKETWTEVAACNERLTASSPALRGRVRRGLLDRVAPQVARWCPRLDRAAALLADQGPQALMRRLWRGRGAVA